jgi:hypothetical protein
MLFGEVKRLFSTTPEVGKETEATRAIGRCTGRGHGLTGRVRSVLAAVRHAGARV